LIVWTRTRSANDISLFGTAIVRGVTRDTRDTSDDSRPVGVAAMNIDAGVP
jgi:hypothetical protein